MNVKQLSFGLVAIFFLTCLTVRAQTLVGQWTEADGSVSMSLQLQKYNNTKGVPVYIDRRTGRLLVDIGAVTFSGTVTTLTNIQVNTIAAGLTFPATQSGTWTVQPGNTANTTPWLFALKDQTNAYYATVLSDGSIKMTMMNGTDGNTTNWWYTGAGYVRPLADSGGRPIVKGWPVYSTNAQFDVYPGAITNGNALAAVLQFDNIAPDVNSPSLLLCATYVCNTNCPLIAKVTAHFFTAAPTAIGANGEVLTTFADNTNYLGALQFTNWTRIGTNMSCTVPGQNIGAHLGIGCATNWVLLTAENTWTNNAGLPKDVLKLTYQKAY